MFSANPLVSKRERTRTAMKIRKGTTQSENGWKAGNLPANFEKPQYQKMSFLVMIAADEWRAFDEGAGRLRAERGDGCGDVGFPS